MKKDSDIIIEQIKVDNLTFNQKITIKYGDLELLRTILKLKYDCKNVFYIYTFLN